MPNVPPPPRGVVASPRAMLDAEALEAALRERPAQTIPPYHPSSRQSLVRVRFHIIRNARIETVGKSQSCMVSNLRIIWKQTVLVVRLDFFVACRLLPLREDRRECARKRERGVCLKYSTPS